MKINQEKLIVAIKALAEWAEKVIADIKALFHENWQWLKKVAIKRYQLEEKKKVVIRKYHKRDFGRQKIAHQVTSRKPQHMVHKIIR